MTESIDYWFSYWGPYVVHTRFKDPTIVTELLEKALEQRKDTARLQELDERVKLAEKIAMAKCGFIPVHFKEYYLYEKKGKLALTLIGPHEWDSPYGKCIAKVRQLGDSTWEKVEKL